MRRLTRLVLWLYPSAWRRRYRAELEALIEDSGLDWRVVADLLKESIKMQFTAWNFGKLAGALGLAGIIVAGVASFLMPPAYVSQADLGLRPFSGDHPQRAIVDQLERMENEILSRVSLARIIQVLDLYPSERESMPLEDVIEKMRSNDIRVRLVSASTFSIEFCYPDKAKAQEAVQALIVKFQDANLDQARVGVYAGDHLRVASPPSLPGIPLLSDWQDVIPIPTWMRPGWVSKARLEMVRATGSENTPQLPERFARMQNIVLSRHSLSAVIQDPRFNLYRQERKSTPLEGVVEEMKKDIRVGKVSDDPLAFAVSFRYSDRFKSQQVLEALVSRFVDADFAAQHQEEATRNIPPPVAKNVMSLDVLRPPMTGRQNRNYYAIILTGMMSGIMLAAVLTLLDKSRRSTLV